MLAGALVRGARRAQRLLWLPTGYLAIVTAAGLPSPPPPPRPGRRFATVVVIPAHNEAEGVAASVASATGDGRRVVVIADNCTDDTAAVAATAGAEVWARDDPIERGKGAALAWAAGRLLEESSWDALLVLDADTVVEPGFFEAVDGRLGEGAPVVQARHQVANETASAVARLAAVSTAIHSTLRQRGRSRLGLAAKLQGTGTVFRREVLMAQPFAAAGLAEDVEYWFRLLESGVRPVYEPAAVVSTVMPEGVAGAAVQRQRWEAGRVEVARRHLWAGLRRAIQRRDLVLAEAVVSELAFPPLATTVTAIVLAGLARFAAERRGLGAATAQGSVVAGYVAGALVAAKAPPATWATLGLAPAVVAWKMALKLRRSGEWRVTPRT